MNPSIWSEMKPIRAWDNVDAQSFRTDIEPLQRPAVLRGLVRHWPAVAKAQESPRALADYLLHHGNARPVLAFVGEPQMRGRYFYREDLRSVNFQQQRIPLKTILSFLLQELHNTNPPFCYAGAVPVAQHLPGLLLDHTMDLIEASVDRQASLWIGNRSRVAAHWDQPQNIACVVAGRRRYALFPIEQAKNLYFGPLDFTPAGQPISLVDFDGPDFERQPRFRAALEHAESAELGPGDAIYIPSLWIHHAESLDAFGLMMNFWWQLTPPHMQSPLFTLLHAMLTLRDLPPAERERWRRVFDLYVFEQDGDPMAHIPEAARGLFAPLTPERAQAVAAHLQESLQRVKGAGKAG
jgi:hypothetical protein